MRGIAGLQHEFDLSRLHGKIGERPLVMHFLDIGIGLADDTGNARECAWQIAQFNPCNG